MEASLGYVHCTTNVLRITDWLKHNGIFDTSTSSPNFKRCSNFAKLVSPYFKQTPLSKRRCPKC